MTNSGTDVSAFISSSANLESTGSLKPQEFLRSKENPSNEPRRQVFPRPMSSSVLDIFLCLSSTACLLNLMLLNAWRDSWTLVWHGSLLRRSYDFMFGVLSTFRKALVRVSRLIGFLEKIPMLGDMDLRARLGLSETWADVLEKMLEAIVSKWLWVLLPIINV